MCRLVLCCLLAASGWAAERFEGEGQTLLTLRFASREVARGLERSGAAIQGLADFAVGSFDGGVWLNQPFDDDDPREARIHGAWIREVSDQGHIELGARAYLLDSVPMGTKRQTGEAFICARWRIREGLEPRVAYFRDFGLRADTAEISVDWSLPLTKWGAYLDTRAWMGWSHAEKWRQDATGAAVRGGYGYGGVEARVPYRVGEHLTVELGTSCSEVWNARGEGAFVRSNRRTNVVATAGVSLDF